MSTRRVGRWAALFGGRPTSFADELAAARDIRVEWRVGSGQRGIVIEEELPGWLDPLWGSHEGWLYLRRPEGVWKARMPESFASDRTPVLVYQRSAVRPETNDLIGASRLGWDLSGSKGWIEGVAEREALRAADLDERSRDNARAAGLASIADDASEWLGRGASEDARGIVAEAGDNFLEAPTFVLHRRFLLARDRSTGWTMAYLMEPRKPEAEALKAGRLWLRWNGPWRDALEVNVVLES